MKLKCWECVIKLLDVIYEIAEQLSIYIIYTYIMVAAVHVTAKTWNLVFFYFHFVPCKSLFLSNEPTICTFLCFLNLFIHIEYLKNTLP